MRQAINIGKQWSTSTPACHRSQSHQMDISWLSEGLSLGSMLTTLPAQTHTPLVAVLSKEDHACSLDERVHLDMFLMQRVCQLHPSTIFSLLCEFSLQILHVWQSLWRWEQSLYKLSKLQGSCQSTCSSRISFNEQQQHIICCCAVRTSDHQCMCGSLTCCWSQQLLHLRAAQKLRMASAVQ